ncbi:MAG: T9SS type B sorting domain-containing protein [Parafilimonas sp.]
MKPIKINICFLVIGCLLQRTVSSAQSCDSNYFSYLYNASDFVSYSKAVATPDNSLLCLQTNRLYFHGLTKFTPQGNVIYAYNYTAPYIANSNHAWTDLIFTDVAAASDTVIYVSGSVTKHGLFFDNTEVPPPRTTAVISRIDKYGKVIWSRFFANANTDPLEFSNLIVLKNGDITGYLTTQVAYPYYGRIVCLSADGTIKWITILNTGNYSSGSMGFPKRSIMQTRNGNIVIGDVVTKSDTVYANGEYHFFALNSTNGSIVWEKSYAYNDLLFIPNITSTFELPDGDLSFQTTSNIRTMADPVGLTKELNIITDSEGNIKKMIAIHPINDFINIVDAKPDNDSNQSLLIVTSDNKPLLMLIDKAGNIIRYNKYGKSDEGVPPTCFVKIGNGYNIFLSELSKSFRMLRTDPIGRLDCDTLNIKMVQETIPAFNGNINNIRTTNSPAENEAPFSTGFFVVQNTVTTNIQRNTVCQKNIPCCVDVVDTNHIKSIDLCEGSSYTLPDKTLVQDSGKYYVSYKTLEGCDSVSLYQIKVYKNPSALSLGLDTCFNGNDTLSIHATDGYNEYTWINDYQTPSSYYTARDSGIYTVTVSNICGTKTDSIHIFNQCDFPVYMPTAFTPNGDRLNDIYKVPAFNLNRLIQLTIYNRWGKIIFQTKNINKGWDGTLNSIPQQPGIYIYTLQMENLTGKKINQEGTFTLIR